MSGAEHLRVFCLSSVLPLRAASHPLFNLTMCSKPPASITDPSLPLRFLLGVWEGKGSGSYPTLATPFSFYERSTFSTISPNRSSIVYHQLTYALVNGVPNFAAPMHVEDGYFTIHPSGVVQLVVVDSGSIATTYDVQVSEGADGGRVVKMTSHGVLAGKTAKPVQGFNRTWMFSVDGTKLDYSADMAAMDQPMQHHLKASLTKVGAAQSLHASTVKEITVAEYLANPTEWHLVDVREEKELTNLGPITGMVAHFALGDAIRLASMNQLPTDWQGKKVLLYCGSGKRSVVAAREILALVPGLNLFSLAGGFKAWKVSQSQ